MNKFEHCWGQGSLYGEGGGLELEGSLVGNWSRDPRPNEQND